MRVKNLHGTSSHSCNCGTWLNHWKNFSGYYRIRPNEEISCSVIGCRNKATDGCHVKKISARAIFESNDWYIVPLCKQCNQRNDDFDIDDSVSFASANVAETCGRSRTDDLRRCVLERREIIDEPQGFRRELISRVPDDRPLSRSVPEERLKVTSETQHLRRFNK